MNIADGLKKEQCTGCGLCSQICPAKCIVMIENSEGFLYPKVDSESCVHCDLCVNKCPILSDGVLSHDEQYPQYYDAINKNEEELKRASSGGVFSALANIILRDGGYVCGCVYNEQMDAVHVLSNNRNTIMRMYGSKYVQSNISNCFYDIRGKLQNGVKVLFTGTACQVAALKSYLGKEDENLYTVDILCHGVPSPGLFRLFVNCLNKKYNHRVVDIKFRDKEKKGWGSEHRTSVLYDNGKKIWPFMPAYFSAFFYGLNLRESCYQCRFAGTNRVSDLTIGDFWGSWQKYGKRFKEGISVISINSDKGNVLFTRIQETFSFVEKLSQQEAICSNDNFYHPVKRPKERDSFYIDLTKYKLCAKRTYFAKTYRKKILASFYGAVIPERIRIKLHVFLHCLKGRTSNNRIKNDL